MTFLGFIVLNDPPKRGVAETIETIRKLGVSLKIITGDNALVSATLAKKILGPSQKILSGAHVDAMSDEDLLREVGDTDVFVEVEPNTKERIIFALRKAGNVVGYLGDGINDASALHAADVGISVESGVDVAKSEADIVLLEKDLNVLADGIQEGRKTFSNTLKYVFMATSANFGNMFSMAGASLFLSFLPLLPKQILLNNLLTDLPEMTISADSVDEELVVAPERWNVKLIRNFMLTFGPVSSLFDFLTFGVLLFVLKAGPSEFRTGWFVESVVSACLIVLVMRTRRLFFKSKPSRYLLLATMAVASMTLVLPFTRLGLLFGFVPLPPVFLLFVGVVVILYVIVVEIAKAIFYGRIKS